MLREEDVSVIRGRASHGGDFVRLIHVPTGFSREHGGPLRDINVNALLAKWQQEIEEQLVKEGRTEFVLPAYRTKSTRQH